MLLKGSYFRFCVLGGGSKGNAILVESATTKILVDAGLSCRQIELRLQKVGVDPVVVNGIVITHEHRDHIQGVTTFRKKYETPLYINPSAYKACRALLGGGTPHFFHSSEDFAIGDLSLSPFSIPHDATDPVGLVVANNGKRLGIASDLGYVTRLVRERLRGVDSLVLESNHDVEMLFSGPYPWALKQRVKGKSGHLSNEETLQLLEELFESSRLKCVILTHLSETNNCPHLLSSSTGKFLREKGVHFDIASQGAVSRVMEV